MRTEVVIRIRERGPSPAITFAALRFQTHVPHSVVVVPGGASAPDSVTDLVAFLDAGCVPDPLWLDSLVRAFDRPFVGAAGGPVFGPTGRPEFDGGVRFRDGRSDPDVRPPYTAYQFPGSDPHAVVSPANCCFRRELLVGLPTPDSCASVIDAGHWVRYRPDAVVRRATNDGPVATAEHVPRERSRVAVLSPSVGDPAMDHLAASLAGRGHEIHCFGPDAGTPGGGFDGLLWRHRIVTTGGGLDYAVEAERAIRGLHDALPLDAVFVSSLGGEGLVCLDRGTIPAVLVLSARRRRTGLEGPDFRRARLVVSPAAATLKRAERDYGPSSDTNCRIVAPPGVAEPSDPPAAEGIAVFTDEADPLKIATARARGLPVVAPAVGGNREFVTDGRDGLLAYPCAPSLERMAERLRDNRSLWRELSDASRRRYERAHRPDTYVARLEAAIAAARAGDRPLA